MDSNPHYLHAGRLIDGRGGPVLKNRLIEIRNGRIHAIGNAAKLSLPVRARLYDASRATVIPGLIDCHVHLAWASTCDAQMRSRQFFESYATVRHTIAANLEKTLNAGIVAVRDGGDAGGHTLRFKNQDAIADPLIVKAAGRAWHQPGRYGRLIGRTVTPGRTLGQALCARLAAPGVEQPDHIKIVNSGLNSLSAYGRQTAPQFKRDELAEAVRIGEQYRLPVVAHANGAEPVRRCIDAGCRSIEHGYFMGDDNLARMADRRTFWVPTVAPMQAFMDQCKINDPRKEVCRRNIEHQFDQIRRAKQLGVKMALGTDAGANGVAHGRAVINELRLFVQAGLKLEEAIQCATQRAAELLELEGRGMLAPGQAATFLVVPPGPGQLLQNPAKYEALFIAGRRVRGQ